MPHLVSVPANIVLVTVDALRLDRLGYAGSTRGLTPHLDALAANGVTFGNLITQAVETPVAHGAIFSGRYPRIGGLRALVNRKHTPPRCRLLAEHLSERGYSTGGFISAYALDRNRGFAAGFDLYGDKLRKDDPFYPLHFGHALLAMEALKRVPVPPFKTMDLAKRRFADATLEEATCWLDSVPQGRPFFLFAHLFDTHCEYYSPTGFRAYPVRSNKKTLREFETGRRAFDCEPLAMIEEQYDRSVAWVDGLLGGLIERLRARDTGGRETVVLVTADHGEGLGDHRYMLHGCELYDEEIRVPGALATLSGAGPRGRIGALTRSIDLAPTLLALAGADAGAGTDAGTPHDADAGAFACDGLDALPLLEASAGSAGDAGGRSHAAANDERIAFTETRHTYLKSRWLRALRSRTHKYIYDASGREELYDLASDPGETRNVLAENRDIAQELLSWQAREVGV